jgi:Glycosyl hydrolases family 16
MRLWASLLCLAAVAAAVGACGKDRPKPDVSTFRHPDAAQWRITAHPLGRGAFVPRNVAFGPTGLTLRLPAGTLDGGELQSKPFRGDGTLTTRMKSAGVPGSISAFFLYKHDYTTDSSDELDFEIPAGPPYTVLLTVWRRGIKVPVAQRKLPVAFNPAAALHDYAFERDGHDVTFLIDGKKVFSSAKAPDDALRPIFNAWYPEWQQPATPPREGTMTVDRFSFTGKG